MMIKYQMVSSPLHLHSLQINGYQYYTPSIQSVAIFNVLFSKRPCSDDINNIKTSIQDYDGHSTNDNEDINVYCAAMVATPPNLLYFNIAHKIYEVEDNLYA
eukprot:387603_1